MIAPGWVSVIPQAARLVALGIVVALMLLSAWAGWMVQGWRLSARLAEAKAAAEQSRAQAEAQARARAEAAARATDRTLSEYLVRALDAERAQGVLRSELDRIARRDRACLSGPVVRLLNDGGAGAGAGPLPEPARQAAHGAAAVAADPAGSAPQPRPLSPGERGEAMSAASEHAVAAWVAQARAAHEACRAQIEAIARWHAEAQPGGWR